MSKKDNDVGIKPKQKNAIIKSFGDLGKASIATRSDTYGIEGDEGNSLSNDVFEFDKIIMNKRDDIKAQVNSHISAYNMSNDGSLMKKENYDNIYDIIKDEGIMNSLQSVLGTHNVKFRQLLQDYEIVKRSIPQVYKVISTLKNNIISPDSITKKAIGLNFPQATPQVQRDEITAMLDKYKLNDVLDRIVLEYMVVSVKYMSVVPYSHIINMLREGSPITECALELDKLTSGCITTLQEAAALNGDVGVSILQENANAFELEAYIDEDGRTIDSKFVPTSYNLQQGDALIESALSEIEFVNGGMAYYKNAILNEAINIDDSKEDQTMKALYKRMTTSQDFKKTTQSCDGMLDPNLISKMEKKVKFKGCHLEELDATRMLPFKMRDTLVGYFYVDDKVGLEHADIQNSGIMEKINSTIYQRATGTDKTSMMENLLVKAVSEKMMKSINPKFLTDNMDDIDVIYEFVRDNNIHKHRKRIVFFHPDDIVEFKRAAGSIMNNCMFLAKMLILTTLSNTIANVTRGADRSFYYVKTGSMGPLYSNVYVK